MEVKTIKEFLSYCPKSGVLHWIKQTSPVSPVGSVAGNRAVSGKQRYIKVQLHGKIMLAHRVAWAITHGEWPRDKIDHINGDPYDNRISNLRCVSDYENMRNLSKHRNGKLFGAHFIRGRWHAAFRQKNEPHHVGVFDTDKEAFAAVYGYLKAKGWLQMRNITLEE